MVVTAELVSLVQNLEGLVSVKEYQGSSYGHVRCSGGDPEGHYRRLEASSVILHAGDARFNAYLRTQFAADVEAVWRGDVPQLSTDTLAVESQGHRSSTYRLGTEGRLDIDYWSNKMGSIERGRGYQFTIRLEAKKDAVGALQQRLVAYLTQLQAIFGLQSFSAPHREAA